MPKATVEGGASSYAEGAPADAEQPVVPEAPSPRAPKAELIEHAVTVAGVDPDAAAAMTKTELVETIASAAPPVPPPPPPPPG